MIACKEHGFQFTYSDDLIEYLADIGTDVKNGARPLERTIENEVTAPLSMIILQLENKTDNNYHKISAKVYDPRDQFERSKLQHHNKKRSQKSILD